jgi:SPP1 family predicted phage head-tail adaptor
MPTYTRRGEFNRKITLQMPLEVQNEETGDIEETWPTLAIVWAAAEPGRGSEYYANSGIVAVSPMLFRFGYRNDITPEVRVIYRGDIYTVDSMQDYRDSRTETWLYAKAGLNAG